MDDAGNCPSSVTRCLLDVSQEQPPFEKKALLAHLKKYVQSLTAKLPADRQDVFKAKVGDAVKFILGKAKDLQL